jgi:hypothetical protein
MEYFKGIVEADPKKLQKALADGEFPMFQEIMQEMIKEKMPQQGGVPAEPVKPEIKESEAKVGKLQAETDLIREKIVTETVNQEVAIAGAEFDDQQMKIKRAETVHNMESDTHTHQREDIKTGAALVSAQDNKPGFNDKTIRSDNKK